MRWTPPVGIAAVCITVGALSTAIALAVLHDSNVVSQIAGIIGTVAAVASLIVAVCAIPKAQSAAGNTARAPRGRAALVFGAVFVVLAMVVPPLAIARHWSGGQVVASPEQASKPADQNPRLICNAAITVLGVTQGGSVFVYPHNDPENGSFDWGQKLVNIGSGWHIGRTLAGPDGVVYLMVADTGELRRYRWNGNGWDTVDNGAQYRVVGNGWSRYAHTEHRNKVTVDEKGRLYEISPQGNLKVFIWDDVTDDWTPETSKGKILDIGWDQYDLVVAAGDGVLYARQPDGDLFRFRYHAGSDRFVRHGLPVGHGWQIFNRIFSPGGEILYGTRADNGGELLWYRYLERTNTWASGGFGKVVGTGWYGELDVTATTDDCKLTGLAMP